MLYCLENAKEYSTYKSYKSAQNQYLKWCANNNVKPIPVDPTALQFYMATRINKVKLSSISKDLSAIRDLSYQFGIPIEWKNFPQIKMLKKGFFKIFGKDEPDKRKPATFNILNIFYGVLDLNNYDDLMYFTWMVIMTTSMLRTSEGAAAHKFVSPNGFDKASYSALWCKNLKIIRDENNPSIIKYMILILKGTKMDTYKQGAETVIGHGIDPINPVKLMTIYLLKRKQLSQTNKKITITANAPLFVFSDGEILTSRVAIEILRTLTTKCKLKGNYSGQSFRMGGSTSYSKRNFSDHVIKKGGRWTSDAFQTYIRFDDEFFAQLPFRALLTPIVNQYNEFGFKR